MNKHFKLILAGAAIVAGLAGAVSCQDLKGELDNISGRVTSLESKIAALESQISSGAMIDHFAQFTEGNGGIEVFLTNGQSFKLTNGASGSSGTSGDAWTIGNDGYWYKNNVKTEYKAVGKDGTDGDSIVWKIENGKFVEYKNDKATGNTAEFLVDGVITAVYDTEAGVLKLYGVEGGKGENKEVVINCLTTLESLVFIPEMYIDGVEGFSFKNFQFMPQALNGKDSNAETQVNKAGATVVNVNPVTVISYHVNPANADLSNLEVGKSTGLKFVVKQKDYVKTRAAASADFGATATLKEIKDGIMKVEVTVKGLPATADQISMLALEVTTKNGTVTSDYATLLKEDLDLLAIALPNAKLTDPLVINLAANSTDAHYRRASKGISNVDDKAYVDTYEAWTAGNADEATVQASCDLTVKYNSSIDLKKYVAAHKVDNNSDDVATAPELSADAFEALGLSWDFAVVKNFKIGNPETDQIHFVNLENGVFTPKVYETTGEAAIGRTPIIRVAIKHGSDVVEYAYIKVYIADKEPADFDAVYTFDGKIGYNCNDKELNTTVEYMNVNIYNVLGLSKAQFHAQFDAVDLDYIPANAPATYANVGTVTENVNTQVEGTYTLKWVITKDEIWNNANKEVTHYIKYYNNANPTLNAVIKLVANIDDIKKSYDIKKADYISNYWDDNKTATRYNVAVPQTVGDADPDHCLFVNDINASFVTWPANSTTGVPGVLKLDESVTKIQYFFCATNGHGINAPKIDGKTVSFTIKNGGLELWAKKAGDAADQLIATITNDETAAIPNTIELNKNSDLAKALLNTKQLYVNLGAKGIVCADNNKEVMITFDGKDHFRADYVRPVDITDVAADYYVDAVDYGEKHSYIAIKDLVSPKDWRGRAFNDPVNDYSTYWDYYGPFQIDVDLNNVTCDLNNTVQAIPATVVLEKKTAAEMQALTGDNTLNDPYGYVTYKNNGTGVSDFNIFLNVEVTYGWGVIVQEGVKVPVKATIEE